MSDGLRIVVGFDLDEAVLHPDKGRPCAHPMNLTFDATEGDYIEYKSNFHGWRRAKIEDLIKAYEEIQSQQIGRKDKHDDR